MTTCLLNHHEKLPPPPEGTRYVRHQAGGHHTKNGDIIIPNLEHLDGSFLKLCRSPRRGDIESSFYKQVFDSSCKDDILMELRNLIPKFHGMYTAEFDGREAHFLKVEDITRQFDRPCVLDVKLKADVHDPRSDHSHPIYTFAVKNGFLIDGLHVFHLPSRKYVSFSKAYGRNLDDNGAVKGLNYYLNADSALDKWLVRSLLDRLHRVSQWALRQHHFAFFRSSLLLVYDARDEQCKDMEEANSRTDVRMVDFAKVYASDQGDPNYAKAVKNLTDYFTVILNGAS